MSMREETLWYFAYGSNLNLATFTGRRRMRPLQMRWGWLNGYRLCFDIPVGPGERGVANICAEAGARICGVLYQLTNDAAGRLDRTEGVEQGVYRRIPVTVTVDGDQRIEAFAYQSTLTMDGRRPSARYIGLLLEGAREHRLPDEYVRYLESIELAVDERLAEQDSSARQDSPAPTSGSNASSHQVVTKRPASGAPYTSLAGAAMPISAPRKESSMATQDRYAAPLDADRWDVPGQFDTTFRWEYADGRDALLKLYSKGKQRQWDADTRIDWSRDLDPENPAGLPDEVIPIFASDVYQRLTAKEKSTVRRHFQSWQLSQFLHGEQGALICTAKIVQQVPMMDAKFYAATQVIDEARHVEVYSRLLHEKFELAYPITPTLKSLLDNVLSDSRWDMTYLGMQVLIEGLALAAFASIRDHARNPLAAA